jgi:hypothetical protein
MLACIECIHQGSERKENASREAQLSSLMPENQMYDLTTAQPENDCNIKGCWTLQTGRDARPGSNCLLNTAKAAPN